jgi:predicted nucleotidyltransferase
MDLPGLLRDRCTKIAEIFSDYGDLQVRIMDPTNLCHSDRNSDVDILINLDQNRDEDVVVCIHELSKFIRKPFGSGGPVRAQDSFDLSMDLISRLKSLLNCSVNVVDDRSLKTYYPLTYSTIHKD